MPAELQNILIQLPIVVAFIWYSQYMNKQFQEFLRDQRAQDRESMQKLATLLEKIDGSIDAHDRKMDAAINRMEERTRPRPSKARDNE